MTQVYDMEIGKTNIHRKIFTNKFDRYSKISKHFVFVSGSDDIILLYAQSRQR